MRHVFIIMHRSFFLVANGSLSDISPILQHSERPFDVLSSSFLFEDEQSFLSNCGMSNNLIESSVLRINTISHVVTQRVQMVVN